MDSDVEKLRIHTATLGMIHKVLIQRSQICVKKQAGKKKQYKMLPMSAETLSD